MALIFYAADLTAIIERIGIYFMDVRAGGISKHINSVGRDLLIRPMSQDLFTHHHSAGDVPLRSHSFYNSLGIRK